MLLKMFSKLDNILCLERKRENRKSSFLIRDILDEGDDEEEEVVVADDDDFPLPGPPLIALPQGTALWDAYPHQLHHEDILSGRLQRGVCTGSLALCCLNCPPQSWHTGFSDLISPNPSVGNPASSTQSSAGLMPQGSVPPAAGSSSWPPCEKESKGGPRKVRRNRTVFTELQLMGLERRFDCQKYLSTPDRSELARALGLTQLQVKTWYQNRRMKWKKQVMQGGCTVPPTKPKGRPKKNSIPSLNETRNAAELAALKDAF